MLDTQCERQGPSPFTFELMWLEEMELTGLIREWWRNCDVGGRLGFVLAHKLISLKLKIKEWVSNHFQEVRAAKKSLLEFGNWMIRKRCFSCQMVRELEGCSLKTFIPGKCERKKLNGGRDHAVNG